MFSCPAVVSHCSCASRLLLRQRVQKIETRRISLLYQNSIVQSAGDEPYQKSFPSLQQMVREEKADAKNYVLIEDSFACISDRTEESLSDLLKSEVREVHKYGIGRRCFALLRLADHSHFLRTSPRHADCVFPIRSRMFLLTNSHKSVTKSSSAPTTVRCSSNETADLLKERNIDDAIDRLVAVNRMSRFGSKLRFFFLNQVEELLCNGFFAGFHFMPFGSSVNGFGSDSSDLDIVMDVTEERELAAGSRQALIYLSKNMQSERMLCQRLVDYVGDQIQFFMPGTGNLQKIGRARVPIVKLHSDLTDLDCDISFQSARVSVRMAEVLFDYSLRDERIFKLVFFIKLWAKEHQLTNQNPGPWYSNFMLMLLVVHFFQKRSGFQLPAMDALSPIQSVAEGADDDMSFETIVRDFFEFISQFDFGKRGISVLHGCTFSKPNDDAIYIENPLEPRLNVSVNVHQSEVRRLVKAANTSLAIIVAAHPYSLSDLCRATTKPTAASYVSYNTRLTRGIPVAEFLAD